METSAKTGFNAENLFIKAAEILYKKDRKLKLDNSAVFSKEPYIHEGIKIQGNDDIDNDNANKRKKKCGC